MKLIRTLILFLLIVTTACFFGCKTEEQQVAPSDVQSHGDLFCGKEFPVQLREAVEITEAFLYTGPFPEDGSFEQKENVFALKVKNNSPKDLQLIRIDIVTESKEYFFEVTTLPSGKTVTVMEKSAATIALTETIQEINERDIVFFNEKLTTHHEIFQITPFDGLMNIVNYSQQDIDSDVYVYYKKFDERGNLFGGITFRSNAGPMKAGELKQIPLQFYNKQDSKVVFITYVSE